jgi:hypothetical protein
VLGATLCRKAWCLLEQYLRARPAPGRRRVVPNAAAARVWRNAHDHAIAAGRAAQLEFRLDVARTGGEVGPAAQASAPVASNGWVTTNATLST